MEKCDKFQQFKTARTFRGACVKASFIENPTLHQTLTLTTFTKPSAEKAYATSGMEHVRRRGIVELLLTLQVTRTGQLYHTEPININLQSESTIVSLLLLLNAILTTCKIIRRQQRTVFC